MKQNKRGDLEASISNIDVRLANAQDNVAARNARIAELEKLLAQARIDAAQAKEDYNNLVAFSIQVPKEISQITRDIAALKARCDLETVTNNLNAIKLKVTKKVND